METTETIRGKEKLCCDGYMFTFDKCSRDGAKKFWRCERKNLGCLARIHTDAGNVFLNTLGRHSHDTDPASIQVRKINSDIKRRAAETTEAPVQVLNNALGNAGPATLGRMPNNDALRKCIQRKRREVAAVPTNPTDLSTLNIQDIYKVYEFSPGHTEQFLLHDSGMDDPERILIFGRESNIQWSPLMKSIFMDGTFRQAPFLFNQIYVILANRGGFIIPIFYALLPNKTRRTYDKLFTGIKDIWPDFSPETISVDFEQAAISSAVAAFPRCSIHGCFFHLVKNLKKKLGDMNMIRNYNNDAEFALAARCIAALAFVPIGRLGDAVEELEDHLPTELVPLLNWFEDVYVGRPNRNGGRRRATFAAEIWNLYDRVINDQNRTNNLAEAAHRKLQTELRMDHPSIWRLIDGLKIIQRNRDAMYERFLQGECPPRKRKKYLLADERIKNIVCTFHNRTIYEFLRGLAHNFLMD